MVNIYVIKLTDEVIYLYHQKTNKLSAETIDLNVIKDNKIYDIKKIINILNNLVRKYKMNNNILKNNHIFLIDKSYSPVDLFVLDHAIKSLNTISYTLIREEELMKENELILWHDILNIVEKLEVINIKKVNYKLNLNQKSYILCGIYDEEQKNMISSIFNIDLLEYENSEIIIFERV